MSFNPSKAIQIAKARLQNPNLFAIVLGQSGGGKSSLAGTLGVRTLYLHGSGEDHGPKAATSDNADVTPICFDRDDEGKILKGDEAYSRLIAILNHKFIKDEGYKAIVIDSANEVEAAIRTSKTFFDSCMTAQGKHNNFQEGPATVALFKPIYDKLKGHADEGRHIVLTCILDVKELGQNGEILDSSPRLRGFHVAEELVRMFDDVLVVGRMEKSGVVKHKLQFNAAVEKVSKDDTGQVKKMLNFSPRLSGHRDVPPLMDANLSEVIKFKAAKKQ